MTLEDLCLVSGICFVLLYAATLAANCLIAIDQRQRNLVLHRKDSPGAAVAKNTTDACRTMKEDRLL